MSSQTGRRTNGVTAIGLLDRRRSRRRELHEPTDVALFGTGKNDEWHCGAVMLNASADGIACRVCDADAARFTAGRVLRVVFRIGDSTEPFDFRARTINTTEGATPGHSLLGLEFIIDGDQPAERKRLLQALAPVREPKE
ncbi:MAG: PilZ domain-containing protein [Phycisphaerales bacterium]|nr:PilZ domain-containing protein [Phycisphaerales bacterium]